jgi:transposase
MRRLYAGSDLHGNNNLIGIVDEEGKRIFKKRLPNERQVILEVLKPYKEEMVGIVVESTYNWYWLVDTLMDEGYKVHLANPPAIEQYSGLKHADDKHDAFWGDASVGDPARGLHLSQGTEAGERPSQKASSPGKTEDVVND